MLHTQSLRSRLYLILAALVLITLIGGLVMVWYTFRIDRLLSGGDGTPSGRLPGS